MGKNKNTEVTAVSDKTVYVVLGIIHLLIALAIVGTNIYFRFNDVHRGEGFDYVDGVITGRYETYKKIGRRKASDTTIIVRYTPEGSKKAREFRGTDFSYSYLFTGTTVRVYYKLDGNIPRDVFIARYDWLVKDYLPADKSYNIPLIIAGVVVLIGIYYLSGNNKKKKGKASPQQQQQVQR